MLQGKGQVLTQHSRRRRCGCPSHGQLQWRALAAGPDARREVEKAAWLLLFDSEVGDSWIGIKGEMLMFLQNTPCARTAQGVPTVTGGRPKHGSHHTTARVDYPTIVPVS